MTSYYPSAPGTTAADHGARHPVNVGHLVMGVAFAGLVAIWALAASDTVTGSNVRFLLPLPWVAAGVAGLVASAVSRRRAEKQRPTYSGIASDAPSTHDSKDVL